MERFIVKHYTEDERPSIKGFGFDGLSIGDDREEAEEFISFINSVLDKLEKLKTIAQRTHYYCEDCWYTCPKHPEGCCNDSDGPECNCGADDHNKKVEELSSITR